MRSIKKYLILIIFSTFLFSYKFIPIFANENYVYLGGDSIGVKFDTGVIITGQFEVMTKNGKTKPWKNSNLIAGDQILKFNGKIVDNNQTLLKYLCITNLTEVDLLIKRNNQKINTTIKVVETINDEKSLGLYVKDQMIGIGTITYIDPETNYFASLGHGVYTDNISLGNIDGNLVYSQVEGIKKGTTGIPGEKRAVLDTNVIGTIKFNDQSGVYGIINSTYQIHNKVKIGSQKEIEKGKAKIYTVINANEIKAYDVVITDYNYQTTKETKGLKIKVIDQNLIKETGGIIQGMSGSPIVQNGKIIGAVSHVSVNNPLIGYGVHIIWMENEINRLSKEFS